VKVEEIRARAESSRAEGKARAKSWKAGRSEVWQVARV
jgi:hypothetical protein